MAFLFFVVTAPKFDSRNTFRVTLDRKFFTINPIWKCVDYAYIRMVLIGSDHIEKAIVDRERKIFQQVPTENYRYSNEKQSDSRKRWKLH